MFPSGSPRGTSPVSGSQNIYCFSSGPVKECNETRANADRLELTAGDPPSADASCLPAPSSGAAWEK